MKVCKFCGQLINDDAIYCPYCGIRVARVEKNTKPSRRGNKILFVFAAIAILVISVLIYRYYATSRIELVPDEVIFEKSGGEAQVTVDYDGFTWRVDKSPVWLNVEPHDHLLYLEALPNNSHQDREDTVTVTSGSHSARLIVRQLGKATYLGIASLRDSVKGEGDTLNLTYFSDGITPTLSLPDFCHELSRGSRGFTILIRPNTSGKTRHGVVTLSEDTCSTIGRFSQPAMENIEP